MKKKIRISELAIIQHHLTTLSGQKGHAHCRCQSYLCVPFMMSQT